MDNPRIGSIYLAGALALASAGEALAGSSLYSGTSLNNGSSYSFLHASTPSNQVGENTHHLYPTSMDFWLDDLDDNGLDQGDVIRVESVLIDMDPLPLGNCDPWAACRGSRLHLDGALTVGASTGSNEWEIGGALDYLIEDLEVDPEFGGNGYADYSWGSTFNFKTDAYSSIFNSVELDAGTGEVSVFLWGANWVTDGSDAATNNDTPGQDEDLGQYYHNNGDPYFVEAPGSVCGDDPYWCKKVDLYSVLETRGIDIAFSGLTEPEPPGDPNVSEPASLALLGLGLLGARLSRRRRAID